MQLNPGGPGGDPGGQKIQQLINSKAMIFVGFRDKSVLVAKKPPRRPKGGHKSPQEDAQESSTAPQERPGEAQGRQEAPTSRQEVPKAAQERPKKSQEGPKSHQEQGLKKILDDPKPK